MTYPTINTGSAKQFEGRIYVVSSFVSKCLWEQNEKMDLFKRVKDDESWLEWKASEYGRTIHFVNGVHGLFKPFELDIVPDYDQGNASAE